MMSRLSGGQCGRKSSAIADVLLTDPIHAGDLPVFLIWKQLFEVRGEGQRRRRRPALPSAAVTGCSEVTGPG